MKELKEYPVHVEIPVRWSDMDAFKHVNNVVYLKWVEIARIEYMTKFITKYQKYKAIESYSRLRYLARSMRNSALSSTTL